MVAVVIFQKLGFFLKEKVHDFVGNGGGDTSSRRRPMKFYVDGGVLQASSTAAMAAATCDTDFRIRNETERERNQKVERTREIEERTATAAAGDGVGILTKSSEVGQRK